MMNKCKNAYEICGLWVIILMNFEYYYELHELYCRHSLFEGKGSQRGKDLNSFLNRFKNYLSIGINQIYSESGAKTIYHQIFFRNRGCITNNIVTYKHFYFFHKKQVKVKSKSSNSRERRGTLYLRCLVLYKEKVCTYI